MSFTLRCDPVFGNMRGEKSSYIYINMGNGFSAYSFNCSDMKILSAIYISSIFLLIYRANNKALPVWIKFYREIPYGDKVGHFFIFGVFTLSLNILLSFRRISLFSKHFFVGSVITFAFITVEEISQLLLVNRNFSITDLLANYLGIMIIGEMLCRLIKRFSDKRACCVDERL